MSKQDDPVPSECELDRMLNMTTAPEASDALRRRILADHERIVRRAQSLDDPFEILSAFLRKRRFLPAGAAAGFGVLGFAIGLSTAATAPVSASEQEALYYADAAADVIFSDDNGDTIWVVE